jgi:hypothetical protein
MLAYADEVTTATLTPAEAPAPSGASAVPAVATVNARQFAARLRELGKLAGANPLAGVQFGAAVTIVATSERTKRHAWGTFTPTGDVVGTGRVTVPLRALADWCARRPRGADVTLTVTDDDQLTAASHSASVTFVATVLACDLDWDQPLPDQLYAWHAGPAEVDALQRCAAHTSVDEYRPVLRCVHVRTDGWAQATDSYTMHIEPLPKPWPVEPIHLPADLVRLLPADGDTEVTTTGRTTTWVRGGQLTVVQLDKHDPGDKSKPAGNGPDCLSLRDKMTSGGQYGPLADLDRGVTLDALADIIATLRSLGHSTNHGQHIELTADPAANRVDLTARVYDTAGVHVHIDGSHADVHTAGTVHLNPVFLRRCAASHGLGRVQLAHTGEVHAPVVITSGRPGAVSMVMPIRPTDTNGLR